MTSQGPNTCCCRCNGTAKCLMCSCVRGKTPCSSCLPGVFRQCRYSVHLLLSATAPYSSSASPSTSSRPSPTSSPTWDFSASCSSSCSSSQPSTVNLPMPNLSTLHHTPKGARDEWARIFSSCLSVVHPDSSPHY